MKLKSCIKKISFIFIMLVLILTLFYIENFKNVNATETIKSESIIDWVLKNDLPNGNYNLTIDGSIDGGNTKETITYPIELINYYDDVTYTISDGENGIVSLGDDSDEYKMLVVKYHKNLTIDEGVTLTANTHTTLVNSINYELTYKKGMYIHVNGTLTNNGTISMTGRGTYNQKGENVYLWKNGDNTFEYVPAIGGSGGKAASVTGNKYYSTGGWYYGITNGNNGANGNSRSLAGGGSGGACVSNKYTVTSGAGSAATSYSGGSGGGGAFNAKRSVTGYSAIANGGSGGAGSTTENSGYTTGAGGGSGNPGGYTYRSSGSLNQTRVPELDGETGTGGLLIIYSKKYNNLNIVESNGKSTKTLAVTGGGSGGGSINIFYKDIIINKGTTSVIGGIASEGTAYSGAGTKGGSGGNGTVTYMTVDAKLNNLSSNKGTLSPKFDPEIEEYTLTLDKYTSKFKLSGSLNDENAIVTGLDTYTISNGEKKQVNVIITGKYGTVKNYKINVTREDFKEGEHSSKLSKLEIEGYEEELNPEFYPLTNEYNLVIPNIEVTLPIEFETFDNEAKVTITGNKFITENTGIITIKVIEPNTETTVYKINYIKDDSMINSSNFDYTGDVQIYKVPFTGYYKLEVWGAQGGNASTIQGGNGGYSIGAYKGNKGDILYVYVGGQGVTKVGYNQKVPGGWNGGGGGYTDSSGAKSTYEMASGGGATDIATTYGKVTYTNYRYIRSVESYKSRIIVSGGGSGAWAAVGASYGASGYSPGAYGGGLTGGSGYKKGAVSTIPTGGSQTSGGKFNDTQIGSIGQFGYGGNEDTVSTAKCGVSGGGGGYYGGAGGNTCNAEYTGGGGSGYIGGVQSLAFSNISIESKTIAGNETIPTHDGTSVMVGNTGNGYAKITPLLISKNNYLSELKSDHGILSPAFDPSIENYTLRLDKYTSSFEITGTLSDENAIVTGLGTYQIENNETKNIEVTVTSEMGEIKTYSIKVTRENFSENEHTSKLSKLEIEDYDNIDPKFHALNQEYTIDLLSNTMDLNIKTETFDSEATVMITGNKYIKNDIGQIIITVKEPHCEDTIYTINYTKNGIVKSTNFSYTGEYQIFTVPSTGKYKIELWGAGGGKVFATYISDYFDQKEDHGKGAYTKGNISLQKGDKLYVYVGESGVTPTSLTSIVHGGWNGGGTSLVSSDNDDFGGTGGGSTDIRLVPTSSKTIWNEFESLKSRIMVAGAGGGSHVGRGTNYTEGMNAGGLSILGKLTNWNSTWTPVVTQITGYKFGVGADGIKAELSAAGAGGGYYGGVQKNVNDSGKSSGGSSYISGHVGSNSITESSTENNIIHTASEIHYSKKVFEDTIMVDGTGYNWTTTRTTQTGMPTHDGSDTMMGNSGNGYAKITPILLSNDNYLRQLLVSKDGIYYDINFDPIMEEYNIEVPVDDTKVKIEARPSSDLSIINGLGEKEILKGKNIFDITVISESGQIRTYKVNITRSASTISKPKNIEITGLVPSLCDNLNYCVLDSKFDENKNTYYMIVPSGIRELEFTVDKSHVYQSVIGSGIVKLSGGENMITIEVTSEDGNNKSVYNYEITRDMTGNNYIDSLQIINPSIDIGFNYLITEYSFKVDNNVTNLEMNIKLDDENASYIVKGNENFSVGNNIVEIEVTAANGETRNYILNVYRVSDSNSLLKTLEVKNGENIYTLSPEFKDIITNYTLNVDNEVETITISANAYSQTTSVKGIGEKKLKVGLNEINILTTAEDGSTENYKIIVTRQKNNNNYLNSLSVNEGNFNEIFDKNQNNYSLTVNPYTKKLTINAIKESSTSKVSISGNSNFKIGENKITITVTAENGEIRKYYIIVTKQGSNINNLKTLYVNSGSLTPEFNKDILEYNIEVENDIQYIIVSGEKEDELSKVIGLNKYSLATGNNRITVKVVSETGVSKSYILNVFRKYNNDCSLKDITISNGELNPKFDKNIFEYNLNVEYNTNKLTVTGIPTVNTSKVIGNGIYNLNVGNNQIILKVISENNSESIYKINVVRDSISSANLTNLIVKEGIISPKFDKMKLNYEVKIPYEVTNINIIYEKEDESSKVIISNNDNLKLGENIVDILVTSSTGDIKTYELKVIRQNQVSDNLSLKTLDVTNCTLNPVFDSDILYYECNVPYEIENVSVNANLVDNSNSIIGIGNYNLIQGKNILGIKVTNKDLIEKDYQVMVNRLKSTESRLKNIIIKNHTLDEIFDKDKYNYSVITKESKLEINPEKIYDDQVITIEGNDNLTLGENKITITVKSPDNSNISIYTLNVLKEKSDNANLSSLTVLNYELSPKFDKGVLNYNLTIPNSESSIIIQGEKEDFNSKVDGLGMHSIDVFENIIEIIITSESGIQKTYTINVTRLGSNNNNLSNLNIKNQTISPKFNKDVLTYNLEVDYGISEVEIEAETEEENAIIKGNGLNKLNIGLNELNVVVTSQNGDIKIYTINVTRKEPITSKLKNIEVKNYYLDKTFNENETEYSIIIDNEVTNLDMLITKLDPNSTYEIVGNNDLKVGLNTIEIISTSSDKIETTTYKLIVNRQSYSNTYLKSLNVDNYEINPKFSKTNLTYDVTVPYETDKVIVNALPENITSIVSGIGEKTLNIGENKEKIIVTSTGGITRVYTLIINRIGSNNANIKSINSRLGKIEKLTDESYKLIVPKSTSLVSSSDINIILEDNYASYIIDESINLNVTNKYKIMVTSPDKSTTKTYIIYIEYEKSSDSSIKELTSSIGELNPKFDKNIFEYKIDVLDTANEIELKVELNDSSSTLLTNDLIYKLYNYSTKINLIVQAEDGSLSTYVIFVEKSLTTEKYLQNIEIKNVKNKCTSCNLPSFEETKYDYSFNVPYNVNEIGFNITKKHRNQKVEIYNDGILVNEYKLSVGINNYEVRVINSFNDVTTYKYTIERFKNTNNYLSNLKLLSPEIQIEDFNREKLEYNVQIPYDYENVHVEAILEDTETAALTISGTTYLIEGNNDIIIKVKSQSGDIREYILHVLRTPQSNNLLKTLTISSGDIYELNPKFMPGVTNYALTVSSIINKITIEGIADSSDATVTGNGEYELKIGINELKITVTSKENIKREYIIKITRESSKNVYLKTLVINNGLLNEEFKKEKTNYTIDISNNINELDMIIEPEDENATYEIIGNNNLTYGQNKVKIKVTSSDLSAAKTYLLIVNKEGEENNYLSKIKLNDKELDDFKKEKTEYNYIVENNIESINIIGIKDSIYSTIEGNGIYSLREGNNIVQLKVISQNNKERLYKLNIYRKYNNYLKNIITDRGSLNPSFKKDHLEYELEVENDIENITIIGLKEDNNSNVLGNGKYNLVVDENKIQLRVQNKDEERIYTINVKRKGSENCYLSYLTVAESVLDKNFDKDILEYTVKIPNDITKLSLDYLTEDKTSTVLVIGNENFTNDIEEVIIKVVSTGLKTKEYKIKVIREETSTFSNKLKSLTISEGTLSPKFEPNINEYAVTVNNDVENIFVSGFRESIDSDVIGFGSYKLNVGRNVIPITLTSKDGKTRTYTVIIYRKEQSDARLSKLSFKDGTLSPEFNKNRYEYVLTVSNDLKIVSINEIKTVETTASYIINGDLTNISNGNTFDILVTSSDKTSTKSYKITLKVEKSDNAYLSNLYSSIGNLTPKFDKEITNYKLNLSSDVKSITINAVKESDKAIVIGDGFYDVNNKKYINILVTAENGNTNVYSIEIIKEKSNNNYLKELNVKGYKINPAFDKNVVEYTLTVPSSEESVIINAIKEDSKATLIYDTEVKLNELNNLITLVVTAENGDIRSYTINIIKDKLLSSKIRNLEIKEGILSPIFNKDILQYDINIPNEYKNITPIIELEETTATYEIIGNENLNVGLNEVQIKVSSSNGTQTVYKINVYRNIYTNNYLKSIEVNNGVIVPNFNKTILNYELEVENDITEITVNATPELSSSKVTGTGTYELFDNINNIVISVQSESGIIRNYIIKVIKKKSTNNYLNEIKLSDGNLNPMFDKEISDYEIIVKDGINKISVIGIPLDPKSVVVGNKEYDIKPGITNITLQVTSENGDIRSYNLKIIRNLSNNTNVINIEPSVGTLSKTFSNDINEYEINVPKDTNILDIYVELESDLSIVTGNNNIVLNEEKTEKEIIITAEDGTQRIIKFVINKPTKVQDILLEEEIIILGLNEEYQINANVIPNNVINKNILYESTDENIITVTSEGKIIAKNIGVARIKLISEEDNDIQTELLVTVLLKTIESDKYELRETEDGKIIIGMNENLTISQLKDSLLNDENTIKVYDNNDDEITNYDEIIKTGQKIKLIIDNIEYDTSIIIVKGDVNGDGVIDVTDKAKIKNHILLKEDIVDYRKYAADINDDNIIDVTDNSKLGDYILLRIESLN